VHRGFSWGELQERDHVDDLRIERRIILKGIFNMGDRKHGMY